LVTFERSTACSISISLLLRAAPRLAAATHS
jgi:hypothetical protein